MFDNFSYRCLVTTQDIVGTQPVLNGERQGKIDLSPASEIKAVVPKDINVYQLQKDIKLYDDSGKNIKSGAELGEMTLSDPDGTVYGTVKLVAAGEILYEQDKQEATDLPLTQRADNVQRNAILMVSAILALFAALTVFALVRRSGAKKRRKVRR